MQVNQGGPANDSTNNASGPGGSVTNYSAFVWDDAVVTSNPISGYEVSRNGSVLTTVSAKTKFMGYISGTTLTVTSVISGTVIPTVRWEASGILSGTLIQGPQLTGTTGGVGTYAVNRSQTLFSSGSPGLFQKWVFIDSAAPNTVDPMWATPGTVYAYTLKTVDSLSQKSVAATPNAYVFYQGISNTGNADLNFGGTTTYNNTINAQPGSPFCIQQVNGGFQPSADFSFSPHWVFNTGAYNFWTFDMNPGTSGIVSGVMLGNARRQGFINNDIFGVAPTIDMIPYGPVPVANTWGTYKVPNNILDWGIYTFTGSINSSGVLTVTNLPAGSVIDNAGYITGPGVPSGTFVLSNISGSYNTTTSSWNLSGPNVPFAATGSQTFTWIGVNLYKFAFASFTGTIYLDNLGWTTT